ncbi:MAG TPA: hypothetical protein DCY88_01230 [Cyanobacteria bacterium UBA11372]|nr:hypothetical protein [Cyanobacteria bacterium UBA11372]
MEGRQPVVFLPFLVFLVFLPFLVFLVFQPWELQFFLRLGLGVGLVEQGCSVRGESVAWVQSASFARKQAVQIQLVSFLLVVWGGRQKLPPAVLCQR